MYVKLNDFRQSGERLENDGAVCKISARIGLLTAQNADD